MKYFYKFYPLIILAIYLGVCVVTPLALTGVVLVAITLIFFNVELKIKPRWGKTEEQKQAELAKKRIEQLKAKKL